MPSQGNQKEWEWDPSKSIWVQKCMPDPAMDLNPRVLQSMLRIEEAHAPVNYFTKEHQNDIRPWMRRMVTTWMLEVNNNYESVTSARYFFTLWSTPKIEKKNFEKNLKKFEKFSVERTR